jgi:putative SOS response-associated peptidase YedK
MPAILDRSGCAAWLDPEQSIDTLRTLLRPLPEQRMRSFPVSDYVNSAFHEGERCIERADEPAEQQLLF